MLWQGFGANLTAKGSRFHINYQAKFSRLSSLALRFKLCGFSSDTCEFRWKLYVLSTLALDFQERFRQLPNLILTQAPIFTSSSLQHTTWSGMVRIHGGYTYIGFKSIQLDQCQTLPFYRRYGRPMVTQAGDFAGPLPFSHTHHLRSSTRILFWFRRNHHGMTTSDVQDVFRGFQRNSTTRDGIWSTVRYPIPTEIIERTLVSLLIRRLCVSPYFRHPTSPLSPTRGFGQRSASPRCSRRSQPGSAQRRPPSPPGCPGRSGRR